MRNAVASIGLTLLLGATTFAQELSPNAPKFVKSTKVPGLMVRYLDFVWSEEAFNALEKGGDHRAGRRSWVLARLMVQSPLKWQGKTIPVGSALLVLNPSRGGTGATLHIQYVDMREVFTDMNVVAEPPEGRTTGPPYPRTSRRWTGLRPTSSSRSRTRARRSSSGSSTATTSRGSR